MPFRFGSGLDEHEEAVWAFGELSRAGVGSVYPAPKARTTLTTNALGQNTFPVAITGAMVGTTRYFQYVTRDPGFGGNLQASDGLAVTFCP